MSKNRAARRRQGRQQQSRQRPRASGGQTGGMPARMSQRRIILVAASVLAIVVLAAIAVVASNTGKSNQAGGTTPMATPTGQAVDGIKCEANEQLVYHIHAHLSIYVNGQSQTVPAGIGIPNGAPQQTTTGQTAVVTGSCFYWLHTHTADGIIHIESPAQQTFTLGNFFDIWAQALTSQQVGGNHGAVIAYLNGQKYTGDPRAIPLTAHALIQLNVGTDVPPQPFTFPAGL